MIYPPHVSMNHWSFVLAEFYWYYFPCCSAFLSGKASQKDVKHSSGWISGVYYRNWKFMALCFVSCEVFRYFVLYFCWRIWYNYDIYAINMGNLQVMYIMLLLLANSQNEDVVDVRYDYCCNSSLICKSENCVLLKAFKWRVILPNFNLTLRFQSSEDSCWPCISVFIL